MEKIAILGAGFIGISLAKGLIRSKKYTHEDLFLVDIKDSKKEGFKIEADKKNAIAESSKIIFLAVQPINLKELLKEISPYLNCEKIIVSMVAGVEIAFLEKYLQNTKNIVRVMPNTALSVCQSMTTICGKEPIVIEKVKKIFDLLGKTSVLTEEKMSAATIISGCGIAYFYRMIRAVSMGGIELGFHAPEAQKMAVQTALGALSVLKEGTHAEAELDKVATPGGITISALNQMEKKGLTSAILDGMKKAFDKLKNH